MSTFFYDCLSEKKSISVPSFLLDTPQDIKNRIIVATEHPFVFFQKGFDPKDPESPSSAFLDLFTYFEQEIRRPEKEIKKLKRPSMAGTVGKKNKPEPPPPHLSPDAVPGVAAEAVPKTFFSFYTDCIQKYISLEDFITFFVIYNLYKKTFGKTLVQLKSLFPHLAPILQRFSSSGNETAKQKFLEAIYLFLVKDSMTSIHFKDLTTPFFTTGKKQTQGHGQGKGPTETLQYFTKKLDATFLRHQMDSIFHQQENLKKKDSKVREDSELYASLPSLPILNDKPYGQVGSFRLVTKETAGTIFNKLVLNEEFPYAHYKIFYKVYFQNGFEPEKNDELTELLKETTNDFDLRIFNTKNQVHFFIRTTEDGIEGQCILLNDSVISTYEELLIFLGFDPKTTPISNKKSLGVMSEFDMVNPVPPGIDSPWSPCESSIFSNLVLNEPLMKRFLSINDTLKISKANHSLFLYYHNLITPGMREEKKKKFTEVQVGGWNKIQSRFGDLTAILQPQQKKRGEFVVHVKIIRSLNQETVDFFKQTLGKLLSRYNDLYPSQVKEFRSLIPGFVPPVPDLTASSGSENNLEPLIFGKGDYYISCQFPKPFPITAQEASTIPGSRKILFPSKKYKHVEPQWYTCDPDVVWKNNKFPYPGLIELRTKYHKLGYAPCCYMKDSEKENKAILEDVSYYIEEGNYRDFDTPISLKTQLKKGRRPIATEDRLINNIGQEGKLPVKAEKFMMILNPSHHYFRIGTGTWRFDAFFGCLEFRRALLGDQMMQSPKTLRKLLGDMDLSVGLQQNFDIGVEGLKHMLLQNNTILDARRWIRIAEEFYKVNIFVLTYHQNEIQIMFPNNYCEYYYTYGQEIQKRPIVFILEQFAGEQAYSRYEMIGFKNKKGELCLDLPFFPEYKFLLYNAFGTFKKDKFITIQETQSDSFLPLSEFTHQMADIYGKTRLLWTHDGIPAVLDQPTAPLPLSTLDLTNKNLLPTVTQIEKYLGLKKMAPLMVEYGKNIIFYRVQGFVPMRICGRAEESELTVLKERWGEERVKKSKDKDPLIGFFIEEKDSFEHQKQRKRLANVLQDFALHSFSLFLHQVNVRKSDRTMTEMVDLFLEECILFLPEEELGYSGIENFYPRISDNNFIFQQVGTSLKMKWPVEIKRKMTFFLQWFAMTKKNFLEGYKDFYELPSYFQYVSDFESQSHHILQNTLLPFYNPTSQFYVKEVLPKILFKFQTPFYYLNPKETPQPRPYLAWITPNKEEGMLAASYYLLQGTFHFPKDFQRVLGYSEGHYSEKLKKNRWRSVPMEGGGKVRFYVFSRETIHVFLIPM